MVVLLLLLLANKQRKKKRKNKGTVRPGRSLGNYQQRQQQPEECQVGKIKAKKRIDQVEKRRSRCLGEAARGCHLRY